MSDYKLVPVEPTRGMVIAGEDAWDSQLDKRLSAKDNGEVFATYPSEETHELCSRVAYRAMIAAAPAVQEEPVAEVVWPDVEGRRGGFRQFGHSSSPRLPAGTKLYKHPQPTEQQSAFLTAGLVDALRQYRHNDGSGLVFGYDLETTQRVVARLVEALEELVDLVEDIRQGVYTPDSFTTQPARVALAAYRKGGDE